MGLFYTSTPFPYAYYYANWHLWLENLFERQKDRNLEASQDTLKNWLLVTFLINPTFPLVLLLASLSLTLPPHPDPLSSSSSKSTSCLYKTKSLQKMNCLNTFFYTSLWRDIKIHPLYLIVIILHVNSKRNIACENPL